MNEEVVSSKEEQEFWGIHNFQEAQDSICCARCGWGFHDSIHKVKEKENG